MIGELQKLIAKHASDGLLIDTNLLLLYLVGAYDKGFIGRFNRTAQYSDEDFQVVCRFVSGFRKVITTPHILAELSNLSFQMPKSKIREYFVYVVDFLRRAGEHYVKKDCMIGSDLLARVGFTDLGIIEAAKQGNYLVLTDDFETAGILRAVKRDVINLNWIRTAQWFGR